MTFKSSRRYLLRVLPLLIFSLMPLAAGYQFAAAGTAPQGSTKAEKAAGWKTYRYPGVAFEFSYPGDFLLDAHVNAKLGFIFALMKKQNTPWLIDIDFSSRANYSMDPYSQMSLEEFAIAIARLACDADGPDGTVYCPGITGRRSFRNRNGLEVMEFYLKQVYKRYDPPKTTESLVGPVEAVLLPTISSGQVLTFKRTDRDVTGLVSSDLLREIAQSVRLSH